MAAEVQHRQRGEHQRVARQQADAWDRHGAAQFLEVVLRSGFVAALEPSAPLQEEAVDSGVVQVVDHRLAKPFERGPAFVRAGAGGDHDAATVLCRGLADHMDHVHPALVVGGLVQAVQQQHGVRLVEFVGEERFVQFPARVRGQKVRDPARVHSGCGSRAALR